MAMPLNVTLLLVSGGFVLETIRALPTMPIAGYTKQELLFTVARPAVVLVMCPQAISSQFLLRYLRCQARQVLQVFKVSLAVYSLRSTLPLTRAAAITTDPPRSSRNIYI
jgi:hypothetical protein